LEAVGPVTDNDGMADDDPTPTRRGDHPVITGLIALVGVAVVVGLILGGGALAATKVLGLGDDDSAADDATSGDSLYLPVPERTSEPSDPLVTFESDATEGATSTNPGKTESTEPEYDISLSAGQTEVTPMEHIDLTGVYPGGEGAILQVQRLEGGKWSDFPVPISVSDETFSTYIQTSQPGLNRFRVIDTANGKASNEVRVKIS
jgi:hypothetical protein